MKHIFKRFNKNFKAKTHSFSEYQNQSVPLITLRERDDRYQRTSHAVTVIITPACAVGRVVGRAVGHLVGRVVGRVVRRVVERVVLRVVRRVVERVVLRVVRRIVERVVLRVLRRVVERVILRVVGRWRGRVGRRWKENEKSIGFCCSLFS